MHRLQPVELRKAAAHDEQREREARVGQRKAPQCRIIAQQRRLVDMRLGTRCQARSRVALLQYGGRGGRSRVCAQRVKQMRFGMRRAVLQWFLDRDAAQLVGTRHRRASRGNVVGSWPAHRYVRGRTVGILSCTASSRYCARKAEHRGERQHADEPRHGIPSRLHARAWSIGHERETEQDGAAEETGQTCDQHGEDDEFVPEAATGSAVVEVGREHDLPDETEDDAEYEGRPGPRQQTQHEWSRVGFRLEVRGVREAGAECRDRGEDRKQRAADADRGLQVPVSALSFIAVTGRTDEDASKSGSSALAGFAGVVQRWSRRRPKPCCNGTMLGTRGRGTSNDTRLPDGADSELLRDMVKSIQAARGL